MLLDMMQQVYPSATKQTHQHFISNSTILYVQLKKEETPQS